MSLWELDDWENFYFCKFYHFDEAKKNLNFKNTQRSPRVPFQYTVQSLCISRTNESSDFIDEIEKDSNKKLQLVHLLDTLWKCYLIIPELWRFFSQISHSTRLFRTFICIFFSPLFHSGARFLVKIPAKHNMTALPTSLRRTLLALLGFTVTIFIMVFYWNQNPPRPAALMNSIFTKVDVPTYVSNCHNLSFPLDLWILNQCINFIKCNQFNRCFYFLLFFFADRWKRLGHINVLVIVAFENIIWLAQSVYHLWVVPWFVVHQIYGQCPLVKCRSVVDR